MLIWILISSVWCPYHTIPEYKGMKSTDLLLKYGISLINIGQKYKLIRIETKINNKFILVDHHLGLQMLGSVFNKSNNDLKEDEHIYNYIKYLENKFK